MNITQALERSFSKNKMALFQCESLQDALVLARGLRSVADCVIAGWQGQLAVAAFKKIEVH